MHEFIKRGITCTIISLIFVITFFYVPPITFTLILITALIEILIVEWPQLMRAHSTTFWLITPFYPILPFGLLIYMNHNTLGHHLLLILFTVVWSYDVGAYCIGKLIGKHKIIPTISPGKTWEGFFGGICICILSFFILRFYNAIPFSYSLLMCISFIVCLTAMLGDLFESWLKRKADIKDTGFILPGHGGFLDRFDSILFVSVPFTIYCFFWLNS